MHDADLSPPCAAATAKAHALQLACDAKEAEVTSILSKACVFNVWLEDILVDTLYFLKVPSDKF